MNSPLLFIANSYLVVVSRGTPALDMGRVVQAAGTTYLVRSYLRRQESSGTTTGADYVPNRRDPGRMLPGASGESYLYRGYALGWCAAPVGYTTGSEPADDSSLWQPLLPETKPSWLIEGIAVTHLQGTEEPKASTIERCTGRYGGLGIDETVGVEIDGIPLVIRSGDLTG